jgi:WhiB family transcriptional regulator, redox-sensing transcriptional regulator
LAFALSGGSPHWLNLHIVGVILILSGTFGLLLPWLARTPRDRFRRWVVPFFPRPGTEPTIYSPLSMTRPSEALPGAIAGSSDWMSRGACRREDPELFFPIAAKGAALHQVSVAKAICLGCSVRAACLAYGLETGQDGIWGGTTWDERYAMPRPPGTDARWAPSRGAQK